LILCVCQTALALSLLSAASGVIIRTIVMNALGEIVEERMRAWNEVKRWKDSNQLYCANWGSFVCLKLGL
jgi:hypothetical protein